MSTNPSTPNDNPESVISVAFFVVDTYPVLVKLVVLTLSSKLKVSRCTLSKPAAKVTSVVVYAERQHSRARHGTAQNSGV